MCKKLPTCTAALVTNPCFVDGLHMKFRWILGGSYKLTITETVSHIWRNCMERKTWNWWHSVILWLSRETGHATSAIRCRKGCKWQWRSCSNNRPPFQAPKKTHFYIHILLERLWWSKTRRTVTRWYASVGNLHWKKKAPAQALFNTLVLYYSGDLGKRIPLWEFIACVSRTEWHLNYWT